MEENGGEGPKRRLSKKQRKRKKQKLEKKKETRKMKGERLSLIGDTAAKAKCSKAVINEERKGKKKQRNKEKELINGMENQ